MAITGGEILTLVGLLVGFGVTLWAAARATGKLDAKVESLKASLDSHKDKTQSFEAETRRELASLHQQVSQVSDHVSAISGFVAAKFDAHGRDIYKVK